MINEELSNPYQPLLSSQNCYIRIVALALSLLFHTFMIEMSLQVHVFRDCDKYSLCKHMTWVAALIWLKLEHC